MEIVFLPGFSSEDFVLTQGSPVPVIVRQDFMNGSEHAYGYLYEHELALGDTIDLFEAATFGLARYLYVPLQLPQGKIIGYFTGGLCRAVDSHDMPISIIIPEELVRNEFSEYYLTSFFENNRLSWRYWNYFGTISYAVARFYINPARNRDLEQLTRIAQLSANNLGVVFDSAIPLELMIHDEILNMTIESMERNLVILRTLYPISIGAAIVLGFGLSLLIMLTNIKDAAIMRILGMSRSKTQTSFWIEQALICFGGIIISLTALLAVGIGLTATSLTLALMYFTGTAIGSAIGVCIINAKAPLELLQVRE